MTVRVQVSPSVRLMFYNIEKSWFIKLKSEIDKPYFSALLDYVEERRKVINVYPSRENMFFCFDLTPFNEVNVVILGQDPYCNVGQANGLAFSVNLGQALPGSLVNIYKELHNDLGYYPSKNGDLSKWGKQGVLLLNTILTVEEKLPGSHFNIGWEFFTSAVINALISSNRSIIFVLWGKNAFEKSDIIDCEKNIIFSSAHPSPMSVNKGFFNSRPFSKINFSLMMLRKKKIDWSLD